MTRIPIWLWVVAFCILLAVCSVACTPKVPPDLYVTPIPPLPVVEHVTGERHPEDGDVLPMEVGDVAPYAGLLVPEALTVEWFAYPSEVAAWKAAAEHQQAWCTRELAYGDAAYGAEWMAHADCRRDLRAQKWVTTGSLVGGIVLGLLAGYAVGQLP